jgi:hypothetical protein
VPVNGTSSWTPLFPRIAGAVTDRDGLPLAALQLEEAMAGPSVSVTVSLLYGTPHQRRVDVATAYVTADRAVRVDELSAFGVKPIVLSLTPLPPVSVGVPTVTSPSPDIETAVRVATDPLPRYEVTLLNHSNRPLMMLAFNAYRDGRIALSGKPRGSRHTALVAPNGTYVLKMNVSPVPGGNGWRSFDTIAITSVLWGDGAIDGDPAAAAETQVVEQGTAAALDRLIPVMRDASVNPAAHPASRVRESLNALSIEIGADELAAAAARVPGSAKLPAGSVRSLMRIGKQNVKTVALEDLDDLPQPVANVAAYAEWLRHAVAEYEAWRGRIRQ